MIKPKSTLKNIKKYKRPAENRKNKIKLDLNENILGCSQSVISAIKNIDCYDVSYYPEYEKFTKKLCSYLNISNEEIFLTNGTNDAIKLVMDTYLEKDDEVIVPVPTFQIFQICASVVGAKKILVKYNKDLTFPIKQILSSIGPNSKLVILVNPNNPTGTIIDDRSIIKIIRRAENAIVLIDEAYYQFSKKSSKDLIKEFENVVITQTFSKAFGLAGVRLGYIIANKKVIDNLNKVALPYCVNSLSIVAGTAALDDLDFVNNYVNEVKDNRKFLEKELKKLGIPVIPSGANFLTAYFGKYRKKIVSSLKEKNILVRDVSTYPLLEGYLRLGIGTKDDCDIVISVIKNTIGKKIILFDMDGVLVDVSRSYRFSIQKTVEFFTKEKIDLKEIQNLKEKGGFNDDWHLTEELILKRNIKNSKKEIIDKFQEFHLGDGEKKGLIENERWVLANHNLKKLYSKYKLGIVTGRPKYEALKILNKEKATKYFDVVITRDDLPKGKSKPDPYSINLALKKLGSHNAIYIGDSIDDLKAAKNAKIDFVGIIPRNIPTSKLRNSFEYLGADKIINDVNEIIDVIK